MRGESTAAKIISKHATGRGSIVRKTIAMKCNSSHRVPITDGWVYERKNDTKVKPLEHDLRQSKNVYLRACRRGMGRNAAVRNAILALKPESVLFVEHKRLFTDSVYVDFMSKGIKVGHCAISLRGIRDLDTMNESRTYEMIVIDDSDDLFFVMETTRSDPTLKRYDEVMRRKLTAARYVLAMDDPSARAKVIIL